MKKDSCLRLEATEGGPLPGVSMNPKYNARKTDEPTLGAEPIPKKRKLADLAAFVAPASTPDDLTAYMRFPIIDLLTNSISAGTVESKDFSFAKLQGELEDRVENVGVLIYRDGGGTDVKVDSDERLRSTVDVLSARFKGNVESDRVCAPSERGLRWCSLPIPRPIS